MKEVNKIKGEEWIDIPEFIGLYRVSNFNRVKSLSRKSRLNEKIIKPNYKNAYVLWKDGCRYYISGKYLKNLVKIDYTKELKNIVLHILTYSGRDITTQERNRELVFLRAVYVSIAREVTGANESEIMNVINRDRSLIYHCIKISKEVLLIEYYSNIYFTYDDIDEPEKEIVTNDYTILKNRYINLKKQYDNSLKSLNNELQLTNNEKKYRLLTDLEKEGYNQRVFLFLKSLDWKQTKEEDKYEFINCNA